MSSEENSHNPKSKVVTFYAWILIVVFSISIPLQTKSSYRDAVLVDFNKSSILLLTLFAFSFYLVPLIFSIGLLKRYKWARIGIMIFSFLLIAKSLLMIFLVKAFYSPEVISILFFLTVFMVLKAEKNKEEFIKLKS